MSSTPEKLNAIKDVIRNRPLERQFGGFDPDANIQKKFKDTNLRTTIKYTIVGAVLFFAPVFITDALDNARDDDESASARSVPEWISLTTSAAMGAAGGAFMAGRKNARRMSDATLTQRAEQILPRLDTLKTEPLSKSQWDDIMKHATLSARGTTIAPNDAIKYKLVSEMSRLDDGYRLAMIQGKLSRADDWVKTMIKAGAYTREH